MVITVTRRFGGIYLLWGLTYTLYEQSVYDFGSDYWDRVKHTISGLVWKNTLYGRHSADWAGAL